MRVVVGACTVVVVGGIATAVQASIPGSDGVIHGCYDSGGNVKVIDTSKTKSCPKGYTALNWSQTGPTARRDRRDRRERRAILARRDRRERRAILAHRDRRARRATLGRKDHRGRWD